MLPTMDEFRAESDRFNRRTIKEFAVAFVGALVIFVVVMQVGNWLEARWGRGIVFLFSPLFLLFVAPFGYVGWRSERPGPQFPRLRCPHCAGALIHPKIVIATRNCQHCGRQVVRLPMEPAKSLACHDQVKASKMLPTHDELHKQNERYSRQMLTWVVCTVLSAVAGQFIGLVAMDLAQSRMTPFASLMMAPLGFIIVGAPMISYCFWKLRRVERPLANWKCSFCEASLANDMGIVLATSHCPYCGQRVASPFANEPIQEVAAKEPETVTDPSIDEQPEPVAVSSEMFRLENVTDIDSLPTVEAFAKETSLITRRTMKRFAIAFGGLLFLCAASMICLVLIVPQDNQPPHEPPTTLERVLPMALFLGGFAWFLVGLISIGRFTKKQSAIVDCPYCHKSLRRGLVIASRHCSHCGRKVVRLPDAALV